MENYVSSFNKSLDELQNKDDNDIQKEIIK